MDESIELKHYLDLSYEKLEEMNIKASEDAVNLTPPALKKKYTTYLEKEKSIKAVTVCFTDIEGRLHMLDYDKKYFLSSIDNLTFDGSSIRGFSAQFESDLRLDVDWGSVRFLPSDVFGPGKIIVFSSVQATDRTPYPADFRGQLKLYAEKMKKKEGITAYAASEIEGFLVAGENAEQNFNPLEGLKLITTGGYFHSLPLDKLRAFIDKAAEAQRALGFKNEKDHPEVAPSQFEMNFSYTDVVRAADQIQLYKLVCRQVARTMGMTATFLPKPLMGINGSGMHTNFSLAKNGKNIFYDAKGADGLSKTAWDVIGKLLNHASEICLIFNSSVNAYRRLDPAFEAPNQIKVSAKDRGSMIRIPVAYEKTARIEVRTVAPDANPYLVLFTIFKTGMEGSRPKVDKDKRERSRFLPGNIYDALRVFKASEFIAKLMGEDNKEKYASFKQAAAEKSPKALGNLVKESEIIYHHDVTNQVLWNKF
jgi:glutamine synthetase